MTTTQDLRGVAFQSLVSLAVAVILYDAGMSLDLRKLRGHTRRVVIRLIAIGVPVTMVLAAVFAGLLQQVLSWEGSLIDPVGGILGAVAFHAVVANTRKGSGYQLGQFLTGIGVGLIIGVLFIAISATVTPASLRHLVLPALALIAALVVLARPLVALLFLVRADGRLDPVTRTGPPEPQSGDTIVLLGPPTGGS